MFIVKFGKSARACASVKPTTLGTCNDATPEVLDLAARNPPTPMTAARKRPPINRKFRPGRSFLILVVTSSPRTALCKSANISAAL